MPAKLNDVLDVVTDRLDKLKSQADLLTYGYVCAIIKGTCDEVGISLISSSTSGQSFKRSTILNYDGN